MNNDYYFVGIGEKSYFYTLNYSYIHYVYEKNTDGKVLPSAVRKHTFIRNLSHDFDEAMAKATEWHKNHKTDNPLKLLDSPKSMSEREKGILEARVAAIKAGWIPFGKYRDQHISNVDKSYIHWVILNIYDPELAEDDQNLMAQICYNYADEQGWIDEWTKIGQDKYFDPEFESNLNSVINGDLFLVGKYKNQSLKDFGYTKKKTMKVAIQDYLNWFRKQKTLVDEVITEFHLQPELMEDGCKYYTLSNEHFANQRTGKPSDYDINVLMVRQMFNRKSNEDSGEAIRPLYRFKWLNRVLPLKHALSLSTCE